MWSRSWSELDLAAVCRVESAACAVQVDSLLEDQKNWAPLSICVTVVTAVCVSTIIVITLWKDPFDFMFNFGR
jgi:hypothetical protein